MTQRLKLFAIITLALTIVSMVSLIFFMPTPPLLAELPFSHAIYDNHQQLLRMTLSQDGKYRLFTPLNEIAPTLQEATLLQEDQYFYWHPGVNPVSLSKAIWLTYVKRSHHMGASTISMQVARIRYHIHSKTAWGKIKQIVRALQLEAHYSKRELLEAYLNLAPYGSNVEGVGAASLLYFNKPASQLTLPDALALVVIPQNPNKKLPNHQQLKNDRAKLFQRWVMAHPEDKQMAALFDLPLAMRPVHDAPFNAPHFVKDVLAHHEFDGEQLTTTLDLRLQNIVQQTTQRYLSRKHAIGVNNASVMLVDTRDMSVKVLLGSADFFNKSISGQVDGTSVKRSPGSTLKPFIYALALDQGLIHPGTVLKDVPRSFGHYNPENFDYDFVGPIKARDALTLSRNIPAVYLADQLHHPSLYQFMKLAEVSSLKSERYYGLALVLGGAEVSMQELVTMYATLANAGVWHPLKFINSHEKIRSQRLLSPEASFLVLDMLKETAMPGVHYQSEAHRDGQIAWKTGTSSAYRDAWTVGVVGPYVLAVWIGNFNNQSNPAFVGKEIAAPLFFEIVQAAKLPTNQSPFHSTKQHLNLTKVKVCKASGLLPTRYCTDTEETWFIPGKSPIKTDNIYREVAIDMRTGLRTCHFDQHTIFEVYEFWPSDLLRIFNRAGIARRTPPAFSADCQSLSNDIRALPPQIISPETSVRYISRLHNVNETTIPFTAVADADVTRFYWFVNDRYLGSSGRDQAFLWHAEPGHWVVRVVDDAGRADARDLQVRVES